MDTSIWDEDSDYVIFDDNSETTIWEDLGKGVTENITDNFQIENNQPTRKSSQQKNHCTSSIWEDLERPKTWIGNGDPSELRTTIWEDLQGRQIESKTNHVKINKSNIIDRRNREYVKEEDPSPQLVMRTSRSNSNTSWGGYSPDKRRTSRSSSIASNAYSPLIGKRTSGKNSATQSPMVIQRRVNRCHSGAIDPSNCSGRIANGPDGTIGFHIGRAGGWSRMQQDEACLSRAYEAMSFFEEIEDNQRSKGCKSWKGNISSHQSSSSSRTTEQHTGKNNFFKEIKDSQRSKRSKSWKGSISSCRSSSSSRPPEQHIVKNKHDSNVSHNGSKSRRNLAGVSGRTRKQAVISQNDVNTFISKKSNNRNHKFKNLNQLPLPTSHNRKLSTTNSLKMSSRRLCEKSKENKGAKSLTLTPRRLHRKDNEDKWNHLLPPLRSDHKLSMESDLSFDILVDEESRLDARIHRLSMNALESENTLRFGSSFKSRFINIEDGTSPAHSRYLETFCQ